MDRPYQYLHVERVDAFRVVKLVRPAYDDDALDQMGDELARLLDEEGCRSVILSLGPEDPKCLYSIFLARLVNLKKRLELAGGTLSLTDVSADTKKIFQVAGIEKFFQFHDTVETALKAV